MVEVPPTLGTHIRPLASVVALVLHQVGALAEALPTVLALVRPLACVDALVLDEV